MRSRSPKPQNRAEAGQALWPREVLWPEGNCIWKGRAEEPTGTVSLPGWLSEQLLRHCFDLICVFVLSNRTRFLSPERNGINSARFFANSVSREEEESYIHMVIVCFTLSCAPPQCAFCELFVEDTCAPESPLQSGNSHVNVLPGYPQLTDSKLLFSPAF